MHHAHSTSREALCVGRYTCCTMAWRTLLLQRLAVIGLILAPAWAQDTPFGSGLYQVMEKAACRSCHNPDGVASATRLHFPDPGSPPEKIEAFGRSLVVLIDRDHPETS